VLLLNDTSQSTYKGTQAQMRTNTETITERRSLKKTKVVPVQRWTGLSKTTWAPSRNVDIWIPDPPHVKENRTLFHGSSVLVNGSRLQASGRVWASLQVAITSGRLQPVHFHTSPMLSSHALPDPQSALGVASVLIVSHRESQRSPNEERAGSPPPSLLSPDPIDLRLSTAKGSPW
jgi:hypothetical protein